MMFDTRHISWKRIAIAWTILAILFGVFFFGPNIYFMTCGSYWSDEGGSEYVHYFGTFPPYPPQWSADGKKISFGSGRTTSQVVELGLIENNVLPLPIGDHSSLSPDGSRIAFPSLRHGEQL